eukprot:3980478-Pyramimonas_sp.AAC.3
MGVEDGQRLSGKCAHCSERTCEQDMHPHDASLLIHGTVFDGTCSVPYFGGSELGGRGTAFTCTTPVPTRVYLAKSLSHNNGTLSFFLMFSNSNSFTRVVLRIRTTSEQDVVNLPPEGDEAVNSSFRPEARTIGCIRSGRNT